MNISQNLVAPQDNIGYFSTLSELAFYVRKTSQAILGAGSQGVSIVMHDGIDVKQSGARQISYTSLEGQPTWTNSIPFR